MSKPRYTREDALQFHLEPTPDKWKVTATIIGPMLAGVDRPIQICSSAPTVNDNVNMAVRSARKIG